jgi:acyl-CoA dehydrogenase
MLLDTAEKMFADHCDKSLLDAAEQGDFPQALYDLIIEGGFQQLAMPESGVELADALAVLKVAGRFALPLPLAEMLLANRWLAGDRVFASIGPGDASGAIDVPWGRAVDTVIALSASGEAFVLTDLQVEMATNLAGEPRDRITAGASRPLQLEEDGHALLALCRAVMMAGGLERALSLSLDYVGEREQFGRPISKFQAIQHHMAVMAAETAAAIRAADAGLAGIGSPRMTEEVAAAKARVGEAVGVVAELAHQVHGAMGYTHEHQLHHTTRRLWAWRDEFGTERLWQERLGRALAERMAVEGDDALWSFIASRG